MTKICKNAIHAGYTFSVDERKTERERMQRDARARRFYEVVENGRDKTTGKSYADWSLLCLEHDMIRRVLDGNNKCAG